MRVLLLLIGGGAGFPDILECKRELKAGAPLPMTRHPHRSDISRELSRCVWLRFCLLIAC